MKWHDIYFQDFPDTDATELVFDAGSSSVPVSLRADDIELLRARVNARPAAGPVLACAPLMPISVVGGPGREATVAGKPAAVITAAEHFIRLLAYGFQAEADAAARQANAEPRPEAEKDERCGGLIENAIIDALAPVRSGLGEEHRLRHLLAALTDLVPWTEVGAYWRKQTAPGAAAVTEAGEEPR